MKGKNLLKQTISYILITFILSSFVFNNTVHSIELFSNSQFTVDVILWNEQGYCEYIKPGKTTLGVDLKIKNISSSDNTIKPYIALYKDSVLFEAKSLTSQNLSSGEEISYSETFHVNEAEIDYSIKIFNWTDGDLKPLNESVTFTNTKTDFYGDSIADASLIQNYNREISGSLNNANDTDYFKIIPQNTSVFSLNCFSTDSAIITLYNSSGTELESHSASIEHTLSAGDNYYIKVFGSGNIADYVLSISETSTDASNFNIYEFDEDVNVYKKSIIDICEDIYAKDADLSKQMYDEYEDILRDDANLHTLPDFLADHPKDIANFDDLINQYFGTKYEAFENIKQRYIALIDKYAEIYETLPTEELASESEEIGVIIKKSTPVLSLDDNIGTSPILPIPPGDEIQQTPATPSLTIVNTTSTSITYTAVFPISGQLYNEIYITDFNTNDGITTWESLYSNDINRPTGQYTISNLTPGGIYVLAMLWSIDNTADNIDSICRFVQLPNNTAETLTLYQGGRVTARLESADKNLASTANFNKWLDRMDNVYLAYKELTGYTPFNSKKIEMRSTRENLNEMFDAVDGLNYFEVISGYYDNTNIFKYSKVFYQGHIRRLSQDDWGDTPIHELSHVFDNKKWVFDAETLAQFKMYYIMEQLNAKIYDFTELNETRWYIGDEYYNYLKYNRYNESYINSFEKGIYTSEGFAALLIDIQKQIGWEPFKKTFRYFNSLPSSQSATSKKNKLKLFLTKLKDYSGEDVLDMISNRDIGILETQYNVTLEYSEPVYPTISAGGSSGGGSSEITLENGNYSTYKFTPTESANYYIYTSPYGGSGVSNDTYIEVYANSSLSGTPIASNDDYDGGRFSKVNVAMTEGTTYYIKVRHYNDGQLHADLNITKNIPVTELTLDSYEDINVAKGEYSMYSFTPQNSMTYVFEVGNYNGGATEYDTYIKLYENQSMTGRLGNDNKKIIVNLTAGHTYYLQFSGFLMKSAKGRISVKQGQTIEFTKSTDSNFIFVNSPEYITNRDIVDDNYYSIDDERLKIFEQKNVSGKNTFYETHHSWYSDPGYYPYDNFYIDIDMYNPTASPITVSIENLAYGVDYSCLQQYYTNGFHREITIAPYSHVPILSHISEPLLCEEIQSGEWARTPVILFDFTVHSGHITISSLAAYNPQNLYLRDGYENIIDNTGVELNNGEIISDLSLRPNETDLYGKIKGIARNESAWIDADISLTIDENTLLDTAIPLFLKDDYYSYGIANPKYSWKSSVSPLNDNWDGVLKALPSGLHNFKYHFGETDREWHFDFLHRDLRFIDISGNSISVNNEVPTEIVNNAKLDMAIGEKQHFAAEEAPDEYSISLGEWGATYHYTVTVNNTTDTTRTVKVKTWSAENLIFGLKIQGENTFTTNYYSKIYNTPETPETTATVAIPANETVTFEYVTLLGGGLGGLNHSLSIK